MIRILIGSILGGIVQWVIGAIAWGTPLSRIALRTLGDAETADLQTAMARTLSMTGNGAYFIPDPVSSARTAMLGRGPVGLIFFNTAGFPPMDWRGIMFGLLLSIVMLLIVGIALRMVDGFAARVRVAGLFAVATVLYFVLSMPVYNAYMPWSWWVYLSVEELVAFGAGAFILIRWFMPKPEAHPTLH